MPARVARSEDQGDYVAPRRAIRIEDVVATVGISKSQIYVLIRAGEFPKPTKLSEQVSVWDSSEVQAWLDAKFAERDSHGDA